jgi:hypothetical protein
MAEYKNEFIKEGKRVDALTQLGYKVLHEMTEIERSDVNISIAHYSKNDMKTGFAI